MTATRFWISAAATEDFLNLVSPFIALIGVGKNNIYGQDKVIKKVPEKEAFDALKEEIDKF